MSQRDELIERVTQEVMRIYGVGGAPAPQAAAPAPAMRVIKGSGAAAVLAAQAAELSTDPAQSCLVLVSGSSRLADATISRFHEVRKRFRKARVLMSENAKSLYQTARRPFAGFEHVFGSDGLDELAAYDQFILLNPTLNTLSKMASLQADNVVARVGRQALLWGRPTSILLEEIPALPEAMMDEFNAIIQKLVRFGYQFPEGLPEASANQAAAPVPTFTAPSLPGPVPEALVSRNGGITGLIDHTLLKPEASRKAIRELCSEAMEHGFFSVCVNTFWVRESAQMLQGSDVKVCTVVGFPLGAIPTEIKALETRQAISDGAGEIDMVMNIGAMKSGDHETVRKDIAAIVEAAQGKVVKVILETGLLSREEILIACKLSKDAGAHFVKTCTGFAKGTATVEHIKLMRSAVGPNIGVKASGGVRDRETAEALVKAGANRIGASSSVAIAKGQRGTSGY